MYASHMLAYLLNKRQKQSDFEGSLTLECVEWMLIANELQ